MPRAMIPKSDIECIGNWSKHPEVKAAATRMLCFMIGKRVHQQRRGLNGRWIKGTIIGLTVREMFYSPHPIVLWDDDEVSEARGSVYYSQK